MGDWKSGMPLPFLVSVLEPRRCSCCSRNCCCSRICAAAAAIRFSWLLDVTELCLDLSYDVFLVMVCNSKWHRAVSQTAFFMLEMAVIFNMRSPGHRPQVVLLPVPRSRIVEAVGGGRVGHVAPAGAVGLQEAAVVVVERVEQHLGLLLEVVGEAPVRSGWKVDSQC